MGAVVGEAVKAVEPMESSRQENNQATIFLSIRANGLEQWAIQVNEQNQSLFPSLSRKLPTKWTSS